MHVHQIIASFRLFHSPLSFAKDTMANAIAMLELQRVKLDFQSLGNLQIGSKVKNSSVKDNENDEKIALRQLPSGVSPPAVLLAKWFLPKWRISQRESLDVSGATKSWSYSKCSKTKTIKTIKNNQNNQNHQLFPSLQTPTDCAWICAMPFAPRVPVRVSLAWDLHRGLALSCLAPWESGFQQRPKTIACTILYQPFLNKNWPHSSTLHLFQIVLGTSLLAVPSRLITENINCFHHTPPKPVNIFIAETLPFCKVCAKWRSRWWRPLSTPPQAAAVANQVSPQRLNSELPMVFGKYMWLIILKCYDLPLENMKTG